MNIHSSLGEPLVKDDVILSHYRRLAGSYNRFLLYSPDFVRCLTTKMVEKLQLDPTDILADVGCGTGMYSADILQQVPLQDPVLGVDPFPEMLQNIPPDVNITPLALDALRFSATHSGYNKVLIKETIHHVDDKRQLLANFYEQLPSGGILLLVHVPPQIKYPLFRKALQRCLNWHADPNELTRMLLDTGFQVERDAVDYQHQIPKEVYFDMVRGCYMSVLTSFEPDELQEGLQEMEATYADQSVLEYVDHFDYLTAIKP